MASPKWQRAKIVDAGGSFDGKWHWVRVGPPTCTDGQINGLTREPALTESVVETNILMHGQAVWSPIRFVELLPEFADDVPLISWDDFIKEHHNG